MASQKFIDDFKKKFDEVKQKTGATSYSDELCLISHIMDKCTHFISHEVIYDNIKDRLVPIFTERDLQQAEASGKGSIDTMNKICECARRLMFDKFEKFVKALAEDHVHAAQEIINTLADLLNKTRIPYLEFSALANMPPRGHHSNSPCFPGTHLKTAERLTNHTHTANLASSPEHSAAFLSSASSGNSRPSSSHNACNTQRCTDGMLSRFCKMSPVASPSHLSEMTTSSTLSSTAQQYASNSTEESKVYDMSTNPRGLALIINNENFHHWKKRQGTSNDATNLYNIFKYLGFNVRTETDKTAQDMKNILQKFSQHRELTNVSSLAVAILTHGGANDCLFGTDGQLCSGQPVPGTYITKMDMIHFFKGFVCQAMEGKPKLFILQACRGNEEDDVAVNQENVRNMSPQTNSDSNIKSDSFPEMLPPCPALLTRSESPTVNRPGRGADTSDMCFVHSSSYGYTAYRLKHDGSPFITVFTQKVKQLARHKEFRDIIQMVQNHFNKEPLPNDKLTLPDFSVQLMSKWFLNPPQWANTG